MIASSPADPLMSGSAAAFDSADPALSARAAVRARRGRAAAGERCRRPATRFVARRAGHLVGAGGKRFRPLLALLAAQLGDPARAEVVDAAVVCELTHLATLYHDDVMDEAAVRRGAPSANSRWTNSIAILTGDFLFARASDLLADLGPEAVRIQARTFERLVTGQIRETVGPLDGEDPVAHHLQVLADKTGSLVATSARFGALLAGVARRPVEVLTALRRGGRRRLPALRRPHRHRQRDRPVGQDARHRPARGHPHPAGAAGPRRRRPGGPRLRELVARPLTDDAEHAEALALLRASPALDRARGVLAERVDEARQVAGGLPDGPARAALVGLADFVLARTG